MSHDLEEAINALWNLDQDLKPVQLGNQREAAIVAGLHGLAAHFGKDIDFTRIDANGELDFNIKGEFRGFCGEYGEELAAVISQVPRRTGIYPTDGSVLPENGWCRINHFDAERLLKIVGHDLFGIDGPSTAPTPNRM